MRDADLNYGAEGYALLDFIWVVLVHDWASSARDSLDEVNLEASADMWRLTYKIL
jgi:hypothetical protein